MLLRRYYIMKTEWIQVRVSEEEKKALSELSEKLDVPASQIVRESVREKIAEAEADKEREAAIA